MDVITIYGVWFIGLAALFGLYMTWGIGANDVANAMGTSVGSKAITVRQAILIAAIFEFGGFIVAGGHVTETVRKREEVGSRLRLYGWIPDRPCHAV